MSLEVMCHARHLPLVKEIADGFRKAAIKDHRDKLVLIDKSGGLRSRRDREYVFFKHPNGTIEVNAIVGKPIDVEARGHDDVQKMGLSLAKVLAVSFAKDDVHVRFSHFEK